MTAAESPHSVDAERAALGSVLITSAALDELADLRVDDFFLPAHRDILEALRSLAAHGKALDVLMLQDELKAMGVLGRLEGGAAYLNDLANATPTASNVRQYAAIVAGKATRRRLIVACSEIASRAYGDAETAEDLVADARAKLAGIEMASDDGPSRIGDDLSTVLDSIEHRADRPYDFFVPTGIKAFDAKVTGLRGGNLIVVAARPARGKSALAMDFLLHAATVGIPALLFSFEMSKPELIERALTKKAQVDGRHIVNGRMSGPEWVRVTSAASKLGPLPFWLVDRNLSAPRICSMARRWLAKQRRAQPDGKDRRLAVIAVDYVGLVKSTGDQQSREREVAMISSSLKQLAEELQVPVIAISQINRESEKTNREPRISDLRESGALEQDANMILFPHWEESAVADRRDGAGIDAQILIAKNRSGPEGFVWVEWIPEWVTFRDAPGTEPAQEALL